MNDANLNSINGAGEQTSKRPRVVIVGGGFGGLAAAKALGKAPVEVILIDRTNHHVFQRNFAEAKKHDCDHGRSHRCR